MSETVVYMMLIRNGPCPFMFHFVRSLSDGSLKHA